MQHREIDDEDDLDNDLNDIIDIKEQDEPGAKKATES